MRRIQSRPALAALRLVGGTALALQLGHRRSDDLDLFGAWEEGVSLEEELRDCGGRVVREGGRGRLRFFTVDGIKVDCAAYAYPWLRPAVEEERIRLAGVEDIAAMKLSAVTNRGTKKDFVDLFFLLQRFSLSEMLGWYQEKYESGSVYLVLRSLVYFEDADPDPGPRMLAAFGWEDAKEAIRQAVRGLA